MTKQRLHPSLAELDILTAGELKTNLGHAFNEALRDSYRTIKLMKLPQIRATAAGASLNLAQSASQAAPVGPEQGFIWMVRRVIVDSNVSADTARYTLFSGSDVQLFDSAHVLEQFSPAGQAVTSPAVPATGVAQQNPTGQPVQVVISPNGATITNVTVNGVTVGTAAGTYYVPAYGSISIAYSVATPTWVWTGTQGQGQPVGLGYYPSSESVWLWPGEQIYAQVSGTTPTNQYVLSGVAIEVAAEMVAKLIML